MNERVVFFLFPVCHRFAGQRVGVTQSGAASRLPAQRRLDGAVAIGAGRRFDTSDVGGGRVAPRAAGRRRWRRRRRRSRVSGGGDDGGGVAGFDFPCISFRISTIRPKQESISIIVNNSAELTKRVRVC